MTRCLLTVLLFLLLGAVANVAVAWGCAACVGAKVVETIPSRPIPGTYLPEHEAKQWWAAHAPRGFPDEPLAARSSSSFGEKTVDMWRPDRNRPGLGDAVVRRRTGWPVQSLEGALWVGRGLIQAAPRPGRRWGVPDAAVDSPIGLLPLRPLWPGFAVNTVFYATILWLLIPGPFALRRFIRRRRGRCPACGYPAGESAACSECGRTLPKGMTAT